MMTAQKQKLLKLVLAELLRIGAFPEARRFRIENESQRAQINELVDNRLLRVENSRLCLTLDGLLAIDSLDAKGLVSRADGLIPYLKQIYRDSEDGRVVADRLAQQLRSDALFVSTGLYFVKELGFWGFNICSSSSSDMAGKVVEMVLTEGILDISTIQDAKKARIERVRSAGESLNQKKETESGAAPGGARFDKVMFFIMPFQRSDVEVVWERVYAPVAKEFSFEPIRIDKTDNGDPKLDQIINGIKYADLILADLTHERPNCYYEVGYARRHLEEDKEEKGNKRIILCARYDHIDPMHWAPRAKWPFFWKKQPGPRVHFDLSGYDVLDWDTKDLKKFEKKLRARIQERLALIPPRNPVPEEKPVTKIMNSMDSGIQTYYQSAVKSKKSEPKKSLEESAKQYKQSAESIWPKK